MTTWTDEEWAVIRAELDARPTRSVKRLDQLRPLLPGRPDIQIHNALNIERRKRRGLCETCGYEPPRPGYKSCQKCCDKGKKIRTGYIARGVCGTCGVNPVSTSSTTQCDECRAKWQERYGQVSRRRYQAAVKSYGKGKGRAYNMLHWLASRALPYMVRSVPPGSHVVDLFGGSGDLGVRCYHAGHDLLAYNDVHPMLVNFVRLIKAGHAGDIEDYADRLVVLSPNRLVKGYTQLRDQLRPDPPDVSELSQPNLVRSIEAAAFLLLLSRNVEGRNMAAQEIKEVKPANRSFLSMARKAQQAWAEAEVEVTCLDFAKAIAYHDGHGVVFLCDPPWPGATGYEYNIDGRHVELIDRLVAAEGNFICVLQSSQESIRAGLRAPYLFWRRAGMYRDLVATDLPLEPTSLEPLDRSRYEFLS